MTNYAIVIAEDEAGLHAIATKYGLTLITQSIVNFGELTTYTSAGFTKAGYIDTGKSGSYALATVP